MFANSNSSRPYSFRWISRISLRVYRSPVLNVELPANDVLANGLLAADFDRPEVRERARRRREADRACVSPAPSCDDVDLRVRVALVLQHVQRALARGDGQLAIERLPRLQRQRLAERPLLRLGQDVETGQLDRRRRDRLAFAMI